MFRNETLDATHLAEFHQIEGVIADYNLSLGELIGVFKAFFSKLGKLFYVGKRTKEAHLNIFSNSNKIFTDTYFQPIPFGQLEQFFVPFAQ